MKLKALFLSLCLTATVCSYAQEVDKELVTANAEAGKTAVDDLKKADTGKNNWKYDGVIGANAAATGLINWAAGGKNNINGVAYAKLHLLYSKDAIAWESNLDTEFGMTWIDQEEDKFQKSSDNIKLATKFGWEFHKNWYLTVLGGFQSQFALGRDYVTGYNPIISKWLAPSYTDISVGIDWKKSVNGADFSLFLSPVAGRIATAYIGETWNQKYTREAALGPYQYAIDHATDEFSRNIAEAEYKIAEAAYDYEDIVNAGYDLRSQLQLANGTYTYFKDGVNAGEKNYRDFRAEFGLSFKGAIAYKYENLTIGTTLALFTPYQGKGFNVKEIFEKEHGAGSYDGYFDFSNNNRFFGHFDVDWDVAISYQFLKVLNVSLSTSLKYYPGTLIADKNGVEKERVQFKSIIGLGIGYSF